MQGLHILYLFVLVLTAYLNNIYCAESDNKQLNNEPVPEKSYAPCKVVAHKSLRDWVYYKCEEPNYACVRCVGYSNLQVVCVTREEYNAQFKLCTLYHKNWQEEANKEAEAELTKKNQKNTFWRH